MGLFQTTSEGKRAVVRPVPHVGGLMALVLAAAFGLPASAVAMADTGGAASLDVVVKGKITPSCRLSGGGDIDFGELSGAREVEADFGLNCNVPFDISFQSARGGLAHAVLPQGQGPFAGTLGYTLSVTIPTISPTPAVLGATYDSENLIARKTLSSGEGIAKGGGRIRIRTDRPSEAGLLAGRYSEVLNVTVSPRV